MLVCVCVCVWAYVRVWVCARVCMSCIAGQVRVEGSRRMSCHGHQCFLLSQRPRCHGSFEPVSTGISLTSTEWSCLDLSYSAPSHTHLTLPLHLFPSLLNSKADWYVVQSKHQFWTCLTDSSFDLTQVREFTNCGSWPEPWCNPPLLKSHSSFSMCTVLCVCDCGGGTEAAQLHYPPSAIL